MVASAILVSNNHYIMYARKDLAPYAPFVKIGKCIFITLSANQVVLYDFTYINNVSNSKLFFYFTFLS